MNHLAESHLRLIDELDARQDAAIAQIDELNERIERLLGEFSNQRDGAPSAHATQQSTGRTPPFADAA
jgi:hypothetical protein